MFLVWSPSIFDELWAGERLCSSERYSQISEIKKFRWSTSNRRWFMVCTQIFRGPCLFTFQKKLRARWFEKSTDVCPIVWNGSRSPQWWAARWRRQSTVHKSSSIVLRLPCGTIEVTCNQVNFLRNHDGTKSEDELLGNAFLLGVDVAYVGTTLQRTSGR